MWRAVLVCVALLATGVVNVAILASPLIRGHLDLRTELGMSETEFQRFLDDQRALSATGPLPTRRRHHDAGVLLNRHLEIDNGTPEERQADVPVWWADPAVADALKCPGAPKGTGPRFLDCLDTLPSGDLSVFDTLHNFDSWDLGSSGPYARYLAANPDAGLLDEAIPVLAPVGALARLRLAEGIRSGDPVPAFRDVRQLALLMWTTDTFLGNLVALSVLRTEQETYAALVASGTLRAEAWTPLPPEQNARYKRVVFGTAAVFMGRGPRDAVPRLMAAVPEPVALCGAVQEAIPMAKLVRGLFTSTWPGEIDLSAELVGIEQVIGAGRCRLPRAREVWTDPRHDLDMLQFATGGPIDGSWVILAAHVPWARQVLGAKALNASTPYFNTYYDDAR